MKKCSITKFVIMHKIKVKRFHLKHPESIHLNKKNIEKNARVFIIYMGKIKLKIATEKFSK